MQNFKDSDYALNKFSKSIVYRFADGILEVTLTDYLAENPGKTESDFNELKRISDEIYLNQVRDENAQTKNNLPFEDSEETGRCCELSTEDLFIDTIDTQKKVKRQQKRISVASYALDKLTEVERRRYLLNAVSGLNERQIAELEGKTQQAISKSLLSADKKIKKFLGSTRKD